MQIFSDSIIYQIIHTSNSSPRKRFFFFVNLLSFTWSLCTKRNARPGFKSNERKTSSMLSFSSMESMSPLPTCKTILYRFRPTTWPKTDFPWHDLSKPTQSSNFWTYLTCFSPTFLRLLSLQHPNLLVQIHFIFPSYNDEIHFSLFSDHRDFQLSFQPS